MTGQTPIIWSYRSALRRGVRLAGFASGAVAVVALGFAAYSRELTWLWGALALFTVGIMLLVTSRPRD